MRWARTWRASRSTGSSPTAALSASDSAARGRAVALAFLLLYATLLVAADEALVPGDARHWQRQALSVNRLAAIAGARQL